MCGIAGFVNIKDSYKKEQISLLCTSMSDSLSHRGPDGSGVWIDEENGVALGHRRLAIIDLTEFGHQPMISHSERYVIILNGEIYNFRSIRTELSRVGCGFKGYSDTEVVLSAIEQWGFDTALSRFIGMFAFVLWDRKDKVLRLVRDRMGEKPLYYGWMGNNFIFASELKALKKHPDFKAEINLDSLALYLRYAYIPTPYSIYKGIFKLLPASVMTLTVKEFEERNLPAAIPYWSIKKTAEYYLQNKFKGSELDATRELDLLLKDAVKIRMESDVPLGVFLSGGIDSSTVSALMQMQASNPVKTFTIGFHEKAYNEAKKAADIARFLGTEHTELCVNPNDLLTVIPQLPDIYDEPFADASQIPTFLVSKLTRRYVTVALSGDGGDELFAGYNRYFWGNFVWNKIRHVPLLLRIIGSQLLYGLSPDSWDMLMKPFLPLFSENLRQNNFGYKIHKLAGILQARTAESIYSSLTSLWTDPSHIVKNSNELSVTALDKKRRPGISNFSELMMYLDMVTYLPDDILVKVDRASMAVGLETRAVYLDHRVVEYSLSIPPEMKVCNFRGKLLLRGVLNKYLPNKFFESPKMGFGLPLDLWLRGPLKDWAENLLNEKKLNEQGFFNPKEIRIKWDEHLSGKRGWGHHIWVILMFQTWKERWL